jgi:hypothetical protein
MSITRFAWALWGMVPVGALAFHYGPGQRIYQQDLAVDLQLAANRLERTAMELQAAAYEKHLGALEARRRLFVENTPEAESACAAAGAAEQAAFRASSAAWKLAADAFGRIQQAAPDTSPDTLRKIRWSRSRALVRAGDIWTGISELEDVLGEIEAEGGESTPMARATREELGAAYYYGARLMRLSGEPEEEWMVDSGKARQQFRYLAEQAKATGLPEEVAQNQQRNVELVLDLEQSALWEIEGKPLPKDSPLGRTGNRPGRTDGKRKQPPRQRDGRGAGGAEEIYEGW